MAVSTIHQFLPGFEGPLPFELETGYIGVGESEEVQLLFYYFVKSESNPKTDPLVLWVTGGPGSTSLSALAFEFGPFTFEKVDNLLPRLVLNPNSWTQFASFVFLDTPVGTGFSYARNPEARKSNTMLACKEAHEFLRKFLVDHHPEFISNPFYVGGDSFSGLIVPIVAELISDEKGIFEPPIDLKGYLLGNPLTTPTDDDYLVPYASGMALISDEVYESLKRNCKGRYHDIDPTNLPHLDDIKTFDQSEGYKLSYTWANDDTVREVLQIPKVSVGYWQRCNYGIAFTTTVWDSVPYHANLSSKGYRSLIYSGDHDLIVPFLATEAWIKSLNYTIVDDWRQWMVEGPVAGYKRKYANKMTFATVKGGGHTAPEYRPVECKAMFKRWISQDPL